MKNFALKNNEFQIKINCLIILFIIFSFSFAILLKDLIKLFNFNEIAFFGKYFKFLYEYIFIFIRLTIIGIFALIIIFYIQKFNKYIFSLLILNLLFFSNLFLSEPIIFNNNFLTFFREQYTNTKYQIAQNSFFLDDNKIILISFFNIIFPLIALSFKEFKFDQNLIIKHYENIYKFYILIFILLITKIFLNLIYTKDSVYNFFSWNIFFKSYLINYHQALLPVSLYLIIIIYKKIFNEEILKISDKVFLSISIITLITFRGYLQIVSILIFTSIISFYKLNFLNFKLYKIKKSLFYFIFIIATFLSLLILMIIMENNDFGFFISASYREIIYKYYLENFENINLFFGNSLIKSLIWVSPHNFIIDILYFSGILGLMLFIFTFYKFFKNYNLISFISFYFLITSLFSGFFFVNTAFIILYAISLNVSKEKL